MTIQQEQQDAAQLTGRDDRPFTVPTPQRVKADLPERRMWIGVVIAGALAVFTVMPNHGLTASDPTPAPTAVVHTSNH